MAKPGFALLVLFLVMTYASAIYFETGQRPAEKTSRAQLAVILPSTLEPATYLMNYAISSPFYSATAGAVGPSSCPASGSGITCVDDATAFTASNELFSVAISKTTGVYSLTVKGRTMFSAAYSRVTEAAGGDHTTGVAEPIVMSYGPSQLTVYWKMTDSKMRVEHFLTIYSNRPELLIQQRVLALADFSVSDLELDRFTGFDATLSRVYGIKSASGEYDGVWGTSFPLYEPWVSAYSPTGEAVGIIFDSMTDSIDTSMDAPNGNIVPHVYPGTLNKDSVITSNVYVVYSNSRHSARELWLKKKGRVQYDYLTSWKLAPLGTPVEQGDSMFTFEFVKPQKYATLASLAFNVTYVDYSDIANKLACFLNGNSLFGRQVYNDTRIAAEFPYRWLNSGTNTVRCRAAGTNTVAIPEVNLTIANMYGAGGFFWGKYGDGGWLLPITLNGLSATRYSARVTIDYNELGLVGTSFDRTSFRLVNEGGFQLPMDVDSRYVKFSVDVPACCVAPRTVYLLFSKNPSAAFFSEAGGALVPPIADLSDFGTSSAYNITVDTGIARPLNPQLIYPKPPSKAEYLPKELSPGIVTEIATKFIFDPATARAAVIKLMVWRKA